MPSEPKDMTLIGMARTLLDFSDRDIDESLRDELVKRPQEWHYRRGRLILEAHPELKQYCKPSLLEGLILAVLWILHVGYAMFLAHQLPWWANCIAIYTFGSVLCFNLFLGSHDLGHRLVVKNIVLARIFQFFISATMWAPATLVFGPHHLSHHSLVGTEEDADNLIFSVFTSTPKWMCTPFRRLLYLSFGVSFKQVINQRIFLARILGYFIKGPKLFDHVKELSLTRPVTMLYGLLDCIVAGILMYTVYQFGGLKGVTYLWMSNCCMYGFGANPAVGWFMMQHLDRTNTESLYKVKSWKAKANQHYSKIETPEHIAKLGVSDKEWAILSSPAVQPTCSTNPSSFLYPALYLNAPLHTEHHDLPQVPAIYLHKVRQGAPEFYDKLWGPSSLTQVVSEFLFDCKATSFSDFGNVEFRHHAKEFVNNSKLD